MIDSFVWLTPLLMLPVVALLVFVGCSFKIGTLAGPLVPVLSATPTPPGQVTLTWPPDSAADMFHVKRGVVSGNYNFFADVTDAVFPDPMVIPGTPYFYVVSASQGGVETANSNEVMVVPVPAGSVVKAFVTGKTLGSVVPSAQGSFGMAIQVGPAPLTVTALGRAFAPGNSQIHNVQILTSAGAAVPGASATVNMLGGTIGVFRYASVQAQPPVVLAANTTYLIVSQEISGGDQFYNHDTTVITTNVATIVGSITGNGTTFTQDANGMVSYGPVDFQHL